MVELDSGERDHPGQWALVVAAWLLVGLPLLWGVWTTLQKAAALFR
jgi:hypothetical protein